VYGESEGEGCALSSRIWEETSLNLASSYSRNVSTHSRVCDAGRSFDSIQPCLEHERNVRQIVPLASLDMTVAHHHEGSGLSTQPARHTVFSQLRVSTMDAKSERHRESLSSLNAAIEAINLAKEIASVTPAKAIFGSVSVVLTVIRVSFLPVRLGRPRADEYRIR
jgi:hypothetical protein